MKSIIKIANNNPRLLRFDYLLTRDCTYRCRYCPDSLHSGINQTINLTELKKFFSQFLDRDLLLNITGGECTIHPQFVDVVNLAKQMNIMVSADTNTVRTARFYADAADLVDVWNVTLHPSQHLLDLSKITVLAEKSLVIVYVMMDPDHWDKSIDWWQQVCQLENIKAIPLQIINNWGGAVCTVEYTNEQRKFLDSTPSYISFTEEKIASAQQDILKIDSTVTYADNTTEILDPYQLVKNNLNSFTGWKCSAGNEIMNIDDRGAVALANCGIKRFKHYTDVQLEPTFICDRSSCTCTADIRATKCIN